MVIEWINKLKYWQVALVIALLGFAVFSVGLGNQFRGDDTLQIVENVPVHSISNIKLFFEGSTFYNGRGIAPLEGSYYRPLMVTSFSLLYTVFGAKPLYFHFFQLIVSIGGAFLLYPILRSFFRPILALPLVVIFLVHPINSQTIYAIPSLQEPLYFFFGALALLFLIKFRTIQGLVFTSLCLFLSLLSKESALVFVALSFAYLFIFDRKRLATFAGIAALPVVLYLVLKINAVGLASNPGIAPISSFGLTERLMTAPSVLAFFFSKIIFPWRLASVYFWTHTKIDFQHVLLPLMIDVLLVSLFIYLAFVIRRRVPKKLFNAYLFFMFWTGLGLVIHLNIIPLDATAYEPWFYLATAGLIGMIGVILSAFQDHVKPRWFITITITLIMLFAFRSFARGFEWRDRHTLALHDIKASKEQYNAYNDIALHHLEHGDSASAKEYLLQSIEIFPSQTAYNNLGWIYLNEGNYAKAAETYDKAIRLKNLITSYRGRALVALVHDDYDANSMFLKRAVDDFPDDKVLWESLAVFEQKHHNNEGAKHAITKAIERGSVPNKLYEDIMNNRAFSTEWIGLIAATN